LWAVSACILNLPPQTRYKPENLLLLACHPSSPKNFSSFMEPLKKDLIKLRRGIPVQNALDSEHNVLTCSLGFITCDMDAKVKVQNCVGYRGYWGCFYCKTPGTYISDSNHVYFPGKKGERREADKLHIYASQQIWGVKGLPVFYDLQKECGIIEFDSIFSVALDIMHQV
jgi:hypothetical protein